MIATGAEAKDVQPQALNLSYMNAPPPAYSGGQQFPNLQYASAAPMPQVGTPITGNQPQYAPQPQYRAQPPFQPPLSDAVRLGEQYRAELLAACAVGRHDRKTTFGVCGIITAVVCFPIGLIALCVDTEDRCARCGIRL